MGVATERLAREAVVLLSAIYLPHEDGLVAGGGEDHVHFLIGGGDAGDPAGVPVKGAAEGESLAHPISARKHELVSSAVRSRLYSRKPTLRSRKWRAEARAMEAAPPCLYPPAPGLILIFQSVIQREVHDAWGLCVWALVREVRKKLFPLGKDDGGKKCQNGGCLQNFP